MKKVLIAISGGISAYKIADVISGLVKNNIDVSVVTTKNALDFITPTVIGALSHKYITEENVNEITHIDVAQSCDLFLCAPATANILGKFANGIADDLVSTIFMAIPKTTPKLIYPAMNTIMWESFAVKRNIETLIGDGCTVIEPDSGRLACGYDGKGKLPKARNIVNEVLEILDNSKPWVFPIPSKVIGTTIDSNSFLWIDITKEVEIPIYPHFGSFGVKRRFDTHRGIDLYAPVDTPVYAVEDGIVEMIRPWTGKDADCDWWLDTDAVLVDGKSGLVVYGEIGVNPDLKEGMSVKAGDLIGWIKRVLKNDKGRPTSMLHIELRKSGYYRNIDKDWDTTPEGILDPTKYLVRSFNHIKK